MRILKILQIAFLFVGTVIGAGFATGKEITTYFSNASLFSLILGGVFLGLYCSIFLYIGKTFPKKNLSEIVMPKYSEIFHFLVNLTIFFMFCGMFDCAEILLIDLYNFKFGGLITVIISFIIAILGMSSIKKVNFIIVPLIIFLIGFVFFKAGSVEVQGKYNFFAPIAYGAMNVTTSGILMSEEGKKLNNKEIITTGIVCAIVFSIMLILNYGVVKGVKASMPFYDVACAIGMKNSAGLLIYFAVFTTLLSTCNLILNYINKFIKNKIVSCFVLLGFSFPIKIYMGFENIVTYIYPITSFLGCLMIVVILFRIAQKNWKFLKFNKKLDKRCKKKEKVVSNIQ